MNERDDQFSPDSAAASGGMGGLDGGRGSDDFDALLAQYDEAAEPEADKPQTGGAPDAATFREAGKRLGLSQDVINEILPANLKTLEQVETARQALLAEVQYEDAVNREFVEFIKADMERIYQAREMSDIMDLRRELSDLNPGFGKKSEHEQTQLLLGKARTDPAIMEAWEDRYSDPAGWRNAKDELAAWTNTVSPYYDEQATSDRLAVADAVRSRGGHRPPRLEPALGQMSDEDFNRHLADEYGIG